MAYREIGGGGYHKWDNEGDILEGIWRGTSYGSKYNNLIGKLEVDGKEIAFSYTAVLAQLLDSVPTGSPVKIKYTGAAKTKSGTAYKTFRVMADTDAGTGPTDLQLRGERGPAHDGMEPPAQTEPPDDFNQKSQPVDDDDTPF
jgi:hypothetical protein